MKIVYNSLVLPFVLFQDSRFSIDRYYYVSFHFLAAESYKMYSVLMLSDFKILVLVHPINKKECE